MKKLLFTMAAFAITSWAMAQKTEGKQKAEDLVSFKEKKHDFGKIKQGVPVTYDFAFQNTYEENSLHCFCSCMHHWWNYGTTIATV